MEADLKLGMRYLGISFRTKFWGFFIIFFEGLCWVFVAAGAMKTGKPVFRGPGFPLCVRG